MFAIKEIEQLAADIWVHVVDNIEDLPSLAAAEADIRAGNMTLEQAQAHEHSDILVEDVEDEEE